MKDERNSAEEALQESEKSWRTVFEAARNVSFITTDLNGTQTRILDFSPGAECIFGYSREEILGEPLAVLHVPKDVGYFPQVIERIRQRRAGLTAELELVRKSGEKFWALVTTLPMFDADRNITKLLGVSLDITEHRRAEEALKESEERYRTLVENLNVGVCRTTPDAPGHYLQVNPALARMFGHDSVEELMKVPLRAVYQNPEDRIAFLEELREKGFVKNKEVRVRKKDGTPIWASVTATTVFSEHGAAKWMDMVIEDITERKRAEEELLAYQGQLRSLASELSLAEEHERRRVAADLHDTVGQLLTIAAMKLGVLQRQADCSDLAGPLKEIGGLVAQALSGAQSLTFELSPFVLHELGLEPAVERLAEQMQEQYGMTIDVTDEGHAKLLDDDVGVLLFKALRELLLNVAKHARATRADISIRRCDEEIHIQVKDDGVGFDASGGPSWAKTKGGFGLFSIRERLNHIGGHLEIQSKPGSGTVATLIAPLKDEGQSKERKGT